MVLVSATENLYSIFIVQRPLWWLLIMIKLKMHSHKLLYLHVLNKSFKAREMAQHLRTLTALPEDLGYFPGQLITVCNPSSKAYDTVA